MTSDEPTADELAENPSPRMRAAEERRRFRELGTSIDRHGLTDKPHDPSGRPLTPYQREEE